LFTHIIMKIGSFDHPSNVVLAPMAGVTDQPFRNLCRRNGTFWTVSEMITSDQKLWQSTKSRTRLCYQNEVGPRWVQIAGGEAEMMAAAAAAAEQRGADIVDINMGCPAKKVCKKAAGSALLKDVGLVQQIFRSIRAAVSIPVTVKIRLGWSLDEVNAPLVAKIAEDEGLSLVTVHGRSRACKFAGSVHYDLIRQVVDSVQIPVLANGDIQSAVDAKRVLTDTGASGVMIGRAAQGRPWLPEQISHYLQFGELKKNPDLGEIKLMLIAHVIELAGFYGELMGPRIARKHVGWYLASPDSETFDSNTSDIGFSSIEAINDHNRSRKEALQAFNRLETLEQQVRSIEAIFDLIGSQNALAA
jgi:tRNA-dihydrouridine synthase B